MELIFSVLCVLSCLLLVEGALRMSKVSLLAGVIVFILCALVVFLRVVVY